MEAVEEEVAAAPPVPNNNDLSPAIAKGKRTKRHRPHSPIPFTISPPPAVDAAANNGRSPSISAASSEESTTTEEVNTARCLLLLSQGYFSKQDPQIPKTAAAAPRAAGGSPCVYTCKTCNRSFSSFQALGGHRASHKKPKNEKKSAIFSDEEDFPSPTMSSSKNKISSNSLSLQLSTISTTTFSATPKSSPSPRIHECSYCGAEFTSGQALGGHMRKHRAGPVARSSPTTDEPEPEPEPEASKKPKNGLSLDLNLPAPEDDNQKFGLGSKREKCPQEKNEAAAGLVLSTTTTTPSFVDCHY